MTTSKSWIDELLVFLYSTGVMIHIFSSIIHTLIAHTAFDSCLRNYQNFHHLQLQFSKFVTNAVVSERAQYR